MPRWAAPALIPSLCPGDDGSRILSGTTVGTDGNLYGIVRSFPCSGVLKSALAGFDGSTGILRFVVAIDNTTATEPGMVHAHRAGLVVFGRTGLHYFSYTGTRVTTVPYPQQLTSELANLSSWRRRTVRRAWSRPGAG